MEQKFSGILSAIISPCNEQDVFLEDKYAEFATGLYKQGVNGLYICGATGDGFKMRLPERKRAAEIAVEVSRDFGGVVIAHVGADSSRDAMELAEHAAQAGVSAVSSLDPINISQAQLVEYYKDIARAARIPVLAYNCPMLTNRRFTVDQMMELLDIDGVVGLKFSDCDLFLLKRILRARPNAIVFNGADELLALALLYGARGGIGMYYNAFPKLFLGVYRAVREGDIERALDLQDRIVALVDVAFRFGIRQTLEFVLKQQGFEAYISRRPRPVLDESSRG